MPDAKFCYKHPTTLARRKCFTCTRPLCPQCQLKLEHHLFCSDLCHKNYLKQLAALQPKPVRRIAIYATLAVLVGGFIYFALLADAFYSGGDQKNQPGLAQIAPSLPVETSETDRTNENVTITRPLNGMKSASQTIEVEGRAPADSVVALYLNGTLVESTVARGSEYRFTNVQLTKHANVLQTRYYSDKGSSNASAAIMVFFQDQILTTSNDWRFFQNSSDNISRGNVSRKEIVLTFDGGSEANSTESILDTLKKYNARATIFLTGEFIERYPELTKRIAAEQEVGNHTFSHEHLTTFAENSTQRTAPNLTREEVQSQLRKTEDVFYKITGARMSPLWRAPYGEHNLEIRRWASEMGYTHVAWTADPKNHQNMDSLDWVPDPSTPGYFPSILIKERLLTFGRNEAAQANGAIILMHLGSQRKETDRLDQWLPEIIQTFRQRGYDFITASELIDRQDLLPGVKVAKQS
jgi:peptidoglycan/xylan/chitin deacetylase (PgdA/CDA1 family)